MFSFSELFAHVVNDAIIEFPDDDDCALDTLAKDLILVLLVLNPDERLGFNGPHEVKQHPYLQDMDWSSLLRYKASRRNDMIIYTLTNFFALYRLNSFHV